MNITQMNNSFEYPGKLVSQIEEQKLVQTSQKAPSIGTIDLDDDCLDLLEDIMSKFMSLIFRCSKTQRIPRKRNFFIINI